MCIQYISEYDSNTAQSDINSTCLKNKKNENRFHRNQKDYDDFLCEPEVTDGHINNGISL